MVNPMNGMVTHHGTPVGAKHKEELPAVSEVKTRMMTDEERAALDEQLGIKRKPKKIKEPIHLSPSGKQTKKEKIFSLLRKGASASEIMEKVGASKTSVYLYQKQYRDSMKETDRKKTLEKIRVGLAKKMEEEKSEDQQMEQKTEKAGRKGCGSTGRKEAEVAKQTVEQKAEPAKVDAVHPAYYKGKSGKDVFDMAMDFGLNAFRTMAIKYIVRAGRKDQGKIIEDLDKAIECLEREKQYVKQEG